MKPFNELLASFYHFDLEAYDFYLRAGLPHALATEKAEQASWLKVLASIKRHHALALGFKSKKLLYLNALCFFTIKNWRGWKSTSASYLYKKIQVFRYNRRGYQSLLSGKYKNTNATAKLSEDQKDMLIRCYNKSQPRTLKGAYKKYVKVVESKIQGGEWIEKDKKGKYTALISLATAKNILRKRT